MRAAIGSPLLFVALAMCAGCVSHESEHRTPRATPASTSRTTKQATSSASCAARLITGDSAGPIRIGRSLDEVRAICPILRDTTVQPDIHSPSERLVTILLGGDTAVLTVGRNRVWQVLLVGGRLATADSVGMGTPLRRLFALAKAKAYGMDGQLLMIVPAKCGLAFGIAGRYATLPNGEKDSATVAARVPSDAVVDRIRIDGCERNDDETLADNDSTFDVQTDSVMVAQQLDGRGGTDYVVRENRPLRGTRGPFAYRVAVYFDSIPASRRPAWATRWDDEFGGEMDVGEVVALRPSGSLVVIGGSEADYTSETLLVIHDGTVAVEMTHGEDYGEGFLDVLKEGGRLVVDASLSHAMVRGQPAGPEMECQNGDWAAVRMPFDETTRRFVPERPRCVKPKRPG